MKNRGGTTNLPFFITITAIVTTAINGILEIEI